MLEMQVSLVQGTVAKPSSSVPPLPRMTNQVPWREKTQALNTSIVIECLQPGYAVVFQD
jgi:hypothetical protein